MKVYVKLGNEMGAKFKESQLQGKTEDAKSHHTGGKTKKRKQDSDVQRNNRSGGN